MNQEALKQILSTRYDRASWQSVLTDVFGVRGLQLTPRSIPLPKNEIAASAVELGSLETIDSRIVGIYEVQLTDKPRIWQNRVGLRQLLRNVYSGDVDAALVVFVQADKWRLSLISEIMIRDADGNVTEQKTEPKRFTYLLGAGQKTTTVTQRLHSLAGENFALDEVRKAFSVEALNKEFYGKVSKKFYELVGATEGKGKKQIKHERKLRLPSTPETARTKYQEFAVRLIGRVVFCRFLKEKRSDAKRPLIPNGLIESSAVRKNYYHSVLEPLFFETLNTPMESRRDDLPAGCEEIPFLNGGLFEPHLEDHYEINKTTGTSNHVNTLIVPDEWFRDFFSMLEEYNFTIDENSPVEVEVSVDPEMLGRIFENLLAEINPDTGESARKATGSFYTPREIVNYMVDESLILYLKSRLQTETLGFAAIGQAQTSFWGNDARTGQLKLEAPIDENRWRGKAEAVDDELRKLFSYSDEKNPFNETESEILIRAIHDCKILDPACGSGAFPIGILQRLVHLLGKLDAENLKWKQWLKLKAIEATKTAYEEGDPTQRDERLLQISGAFEKESSDYGRKLFLIENCIYGVDIQPIAAEISKLRCFLTLVVDDTIHDNDPNRGVNPLPNLEFKFVAANSLLPLPEGGLFQSTTGALLSRLGSVRHEYINSFGEKKATAKRHFKDIQDEIFDEQIRQNRENPDKRAIELSKWDPFSQAKVDWFDPLWMFGIKSFHIVIGNPPYLESRHPNFAEATKLALQKAVATRWGKDSEYITRGADLLIYFFEAALKQIEKNGLVVLITQNAWLDTDYGKKFQTFLTAKTSVRTIIDSDFKYFDSSAGPNINTVISIFQGTDASADNPLVFARFHQNLDSTSISILDTMSPPIPKEIAEVKAYRYNDPLLKQLKWGILLAAQDDLYYHLFAVLKERAKQIEEIAPGVSIGQGLNLSKSCFVTHEQIRRHEIPISSCFQIFTSDDGAPYQIAKTNFLLVDKQKIDSTTEGKLKNDAISTFDSATTRKKPPILILPRGVSRHFCTMNAERTFSASGVDVYDDYGELTDEMRLNLWLALNSSVAWLWREISGRKNLGGGMLKAEATDLKALPIYMDFNSSKDVQAIFRSLKIREASETLSELYTREHRVIDEMVAGFLGFSAEEMNHIVKMLAETINSRSAKAKS